MKTILEDAAVLTSGNITMVFVDCSPCGMAFAVTSDFDQRCHTEGGRLCKFYCPRNQVYVTKNQCLKIKKRTSRVRCGVARDSTVHLG